MGKLRVNDKSQKEYNDLYSKVIQRAKSRVSDVNRNVGFYGVQDLVVDIQESAGSVLYADFNNSKKGIKIKNSTLASVTKIF